MERKQGDVMSTYTRIVLELEARYGPQPLLWMIVGMMEGDV